MGLHCSDRAGGGSNKHDAGNIPAMQECLERKLMRAEWKRGVVGDRDSVGPAADDGFFGFLSAREKRS